MSTGYIRLDFNFCNRPIARLGIGNSHTRLSWKRSSDSASARILNTTISVPNSERPHWPTGLDMLTLFAVKRLAYVHRDPEMEFYTAKQMVETLGLPINWRSPRHMDTLHARLKRWTHTTITWHRFYFNRKSYRQLTVPPPLTVTKRGRAVRITLHPEWYSRFVLNIYRPLLFPWPLPADPGPQNIVLATTLWKRRYVTGSALRRTLVFKSRPEFDTELGVLEEFESTRQRLDSWLRSQGGKLEQVATANGLVEDEWAWKLKRTLRLDRRNTSTALALTIKLPLIMVDGRFHRQRGQYV